MAKKITHTTIRNSNLFCMNCGGEQVIPYPIQIPMMTAMMDAFNKMHKACNPVWKQPKVNQDLNEQEKALWWMNYGEHGTSSKTIWNVMMEDFTRGVMIAPGTLDKVTMDACEYSHPYDPDDFRRCYVLLNTIPEWKGKLDKMRNVSEVWNRLVDNWDKLTIMLEEAMKLEEDGKNSDKMMKFMDVIIDKK